MARSQSSCCSTLDWPAQPQNWGPWASDITVEALLLTLKGWQDWVWDPWRADWRTVHSGLTPGILESPRLRRAVRSDRAAPASRHKKITAGRYPQRVIGRLGEETSQWQQRTEAADRFPAALLLLKERSRNQADSSHFMGNEGAGTTVRRTEAGPRPSTPPGAELGMSDGALPGGSRQKDAAHVRDHSQELGARRPGGEPSALTQPCHPCRPQSSVPEPEVHV